MYDFHDGNEIAPNSKDKMPLALSPLAAGDPAENFEDYELIDINELITGGREGFRAYRVTGDSMVDHIMPGYIVFADTYCDPQHGDVIVSRINGKNCVKRFEQTSNGLYLVSANKTYEPIKIRKTDDFYILGVVRSHLAVYKK